MSSTPPSIRAADSSAGNSPALVHSRIVHVMRRFVPAKWGGTESVVYHLAREYERLGMESPIYATAMFARPGVETFGGVTIHRFPYSLPWWGLRPAAREALELKGGNPLSFSMLRALWCDRRATLFHAHVQHRLGGTVRRAARHLGLPYAVSIHGGHHTLPSEQTAAMLQPTQGTIEWGKVAGWALGARRTLDDAGAIFCVGQEEYQAMREERPGESVHYQPNGVEVNRFRRARAEAFWEKVPELRGRRLLLCVSRVDPQKNQLLLLEAFARLQRDFPQHHVVLIGAEVAPDYARRLRQWTIDLGLTERLTWLPGLSPEDSALAGAYRAAEVFILPSDHEPFGIVLLEAWAAGLPAVATRVGGIPGFTTDEKNILLVPPGDPEALAGALRRLLTDHELAGRLAEAGAREVAAHYDWPVVAQRLLTLYPSKTS